MGKKMKYEAAFYQCYLCGATAAEEALVPHDKVALCIACEATAEYWYGNPIADEPPKRCPSCGSSHVDPEWTDIENCEFDEERAAELHPNLDEEEWMFSDTYWTFTYVYDCVLCENCEEAWPYGRRYYYNPVDNTYTAQRPMGNQDILRAERERQEAAGQLPLFSAQSDR